MPLSDRLSHQSAAILCAVVAGVAASSPSAAATVAHLLIVAGQSNAVGYAANANQLPSSLYKAQRDIPYQHNISGLLPTTTFTALRWLNDTGFASVFPKFCGPELSLARTIADAFPDTQFVVVKVAYSGTSLAYDWDPMRAGSLYTTLTRTVSDVQADLTARGMTSVVDGMFWMQGESDATVLEWANAYQANLTAFIADCRAAFNAPQMPFVLGRINQVAGWTYGPTVRAAEVAVADADPLADWVNTDALPLFVDLVHYTGTGEVTLGDDMAASYLTMVAPRHRRGVSPEVAAAAGIPASSGPSVVASAAGRGVVDIAFEIPRAGHASLTLVDARGRLLATVVDGELTEGRHHVTVELAAGRGIAFAVLRDGDVTRTSKVLLAAR